MYHLEAHFSSGPLPTSYYKARMRTSKVPGPTTHSILPSLVLLPAMQGASRLSIIPARTIWYYIAHIVSTVIYQLSAIYQFKTHQSSIVLIAFIVVRPKSFCFLLMKKGPKKHQGHHLRARSSQQAGESHDESKDNRSSYFLRNEFCSAGTRLRSPGLLQKTGIFLLIVESSLKPEESYLEPIRS